MKTFAAFLLLKKNNNNKQSKTRQAEEKYKNNTEYNDKPRTQRASTRYVAYSMSVLCVLHAYSTRISRVLHTNS